MKKLFLLFIISVFAFSCANKHEVDLIVHNANVYTVDNDFAKAEAFAVRDGKFIAVGNNNEILNNFKAPKTIDAKGSALYPGFIDGHCHFSGYGDNITRYADLKGCKSFDEVLQRLEKHNKTNKSEWLLGRGWDQNLWDNPVFPDNKRLSEMFPDKKVALTRVDGHAGLVSESALKAAGLTANTKVEGGKVMVDKSNRPTGVLIDNAFSYVRRIIPSLTREQKAQALLNAQKNCFAVGLSAVSEAGSALNQVLLIDSLQKQGSLKMKMNIMLSPTKATLEYFLTKGVIEKERLTVRSIKMFADGALGSRGAYMIEPYSDDAKNKGLMLDSKEAYKEVCQKAFDANYQVATHVIGDGAVREMLNIYGEVLQGSNDRRWRLEHSQIVKPEDFQLFKKYSIIPSIQSTHCTSDMFWAVDRIGEERLKNAYAQQTLLDQNGWLINGTDFPIENINPIYTFYAAVARKNLEGKPEGGFQMENALSKEDALRSMTIWAAKGHFAENRQGSIEVGKEADFVMLDRDIMNVEEDKIPTTKVTALYVNGEKVTE